MLGMLTKQQIERVLLEQVVGRIGYCYDGQVFIVPVTYAYDGERVICHSADGHKIHAMRQKPNVCFEVEDVKNLSVWQSVVARGEFCELAGREAAEALSLLVSRLLPVVSSATSVPKGVISVTPYHDTAEDVTAVIFAINLKELVGRYEAR